MTSTVDLVAGALLVATWRKRAEAEALEVGVLLDAVEWCRLHEVADEFSAATWCESGLLLAGEGAPWVAEFCIVDFGAGLGVSTDWARVYLAQVLELAHRLPRIFDRVTAGVLPVWRARRIAERTIALSAEAAGFVDAQLAGFAHKTGPAATERLVDEAIVRFMPEAAAGLAARAAEGRYVTIEHDGTPGSGVSSIHGSLDLADALDLEHALQDGAHALRAAGSEDTLDVRRSIALGDLARGHQTLGFGAPGFGAAGFETGASAPSSTTGDVEPVETPRVLRDLSLYVHLDGTQLAKVENAGGHLITQDQITKWCGPDTKVTIKPVIDLNTTISTDAYAVPDKVREHVILRDRTCVFPWCHRKARSCDLDHIDPYDPAGPPGQTNTGNLAPLCRRHHRLKTFTDWTHTMLEPGTYLWRSPHGFSYLRDRQGTQDLSPPALEPPA